MKATSGYIVVLNDGETWAPLEGCAIYKLKDTRPIALADNLDEVLGESSDTDDGEVLANVASMWADVQIVEVLNPPEECPPATEYSLCR